MASSSVNGAARATGAPLPSLPPSPPEEVAAFYTLVEKRVTTGVLNRHARCVELSDRAARSAARLYGDNSLVVADLRVSEAGAIRNLACVSTPCSEKVALLQRAWALLVPVHALLLRRLADNTLLPGTIEDGESTYFVRQKVFTWKARDESVPSDADLQGLGVLLGYEKLLRAMVLTLALLFELRGFALPRESACFFVLTAFDAIPRMATMQHDLTSEAYLVTMMETRMKPQNYEPSFCAAVLRKWRSSAVADVLRARGVLQTGEATCHESMGVFSPTHSPALAVRAATCSLTSLAAALLAAFRRPIESMIQTRAAVLSSSSFSQSVVPFRVHFTGLSKIRSDLFFRRRDTTRPTPLEWPRDQPRGAVRRTGGWRRGAVGAVGVVGR